MELVKTMRNLNKKKHWGTIENIDFLILGHPRSGTGYMAELFSAYGQPVGHETVGKKGISCWTFVIPDANYLSGSPIPNITKTIARKSRQDFKYKYLIHAIRDPFDVINSIYLTESKATSHIFRMLHCKPEISKDLDTLSKTILSVIRWNDMIENLKPNLKVKIESAEKPIQDFLINHEYRVVVGDMPPKNVNSRKKSHEGKLTIESYKNVPDDILQSLDIFCRKHGYKNILK